MAAWSAYGPGGRRSVSARSTSGSADAIAPRSQRERSCASSSTSSPSAPTRAARRECWSSISASRPAGSGSPGQQHVHDAREPDRLRREVVADERVPAGGRVALVEHEVEHGEDGGEPVLQRVGRRLLDRDAGEPDLLLRPHQPLRDRRLRHQQRAGDLGDGQAADEPQRERHLRLGRQRRMTAGEHEPEALVGDHRGVLARQVANRLLQVAREQRLLVAQRGLPPQPVDRAPLGGREDPRRRRGRDAVARPAVQRDGVCVLDGLLGAVDVAAEPAREDRHRAAELGAEAACDRVGRRSAGGRGQPCSNSWIGRSSILPYLAAGHLCAHSIAASRFSTSST